MQRHETRVCNFSSQIAYCYNLQLQLLRLPPARGMGLQGEDGCKENCPRSIFFFLCYRLAGQFLFIGLNLFFSLACSYIASSFSAPQRPQEGERHSTSNSMVKMCVLFLIAAQSGLDNAWQRCVAISMRSFIIIYRIGQLDYEEIRWSINNLNILHCTFSFHRLASSAAYLCCCFSCSVIAK